LIEAIEAIIKSFTSFLYRDVMFVLGGSAIITSWLYKYDRIPSGEPSVAAYILTAGFAYAVGYAVQDIFTIFRIVRTKAGMAPSPFGKFLYRLFERRNVEFEKFSNQEYEKAKEWLYRDNKVQRFRADYERIESLKQVGTTLGLCIAISGVILFLKYLLDDTCDSFDIATAAAAILLGTVLWSLGWLKVTQQAQYLLKRYQGKPSQEEEKMRQV